MGILPLNADILPPSDKRVFKKIQISPEAKPALTDLISVIIGRPVTGVEIRNNELPADDTEEKAYTICVTCIHPSPQKV